MKKAVLVSIADIFAYAKKNFDISWNKACDLFNDYYAHDGITFLEQLYDNETLDVVPISNMDTAQYADYIVREYIRTLNIPEDYEVLMDGR